MCNLSGIFGLQGHSTYVHMQSSFGKTPIDEIFRLVNKAYVLYLGTTQVRIRGRSGDSVLYTVVHHLLPQRLVDATYDHQVQQ